MLATALLWAACLSGYAQTDVTAQYLANPGFEGSYAIHTDQPASDRAIYQPEGWSVDWAKNSDDLTALTTSDLYANLITGSFTMIDPTTRGNKTYWARLSYKRISSPRFRIYQTITLPAGTWRLSADMLQYNASSTNTASLFAGSNSTACPSSSTKSDAAGWNRVQVEFELLEETTLEVGFSISHTVTQKEQIVGVDNFMLELLAEASGEVSYTSRLVNPSFEYTAEGVAWTATWRGDPWGWTRTGALSGNSYGISNDGTNRNGNALCWYRSVPMPDEFEMSQTVEGLPKGLYRVSCKMMVVSGMLSNQRLFANGYAHYFGSADMYGSNIDATAISSYANLTPSSTDKPLQDMSMEMLLFEGEALTLGIRSGNLLPDGSRSASGAGWFKADDFRLVWQGYDPQDYLDFLAPYVSEAATLLTKDMDATVRADLQTAYDTASALTVETENTAVKSATDALLAALTAARASVEEYAEKPDVSLVMDMVHHNPGEPRYEDSRYNDPAELAAMGYNAKCFYLFDSPTLAIDWSGYDTNLPAPGTDEQNWLTEKQTRLNTLYDECEANNIDVYAMCDLVLLPKRIVNYYGIGSTYGDALNATTQALLRYQIQQSFAQFPQLDGLVVRIGETYLQDAPYHQGSIQNKTSAQNCIVPLMQLLREEVCVRLGKKLVFRTWMSFDEDLSVYNEVSSSVEPHPNLYLGVKHCEGDFHRGDPFSKVLGQGRHQQIVEVQCAREYEGKGAFPNYVARGVIDGFEEDYNRRDNNLYWNLRDIRNSGKLTGVWTWTRGGGWEGPYIKDELWCDLNAWVMAQWALDPEKTEEEIFNAYATERLHLDADNAALLRQIALLSEHAVIRGLRSAAYPSDIFNMWVRDEYITFPSMPSAEHTATILDERDAALADWEQINALAQQFNSTDAHLNEVVKVTCNYGLQMFRIFRDVSYAAAFTQGRYSGDVKPMVNDYFEAWHQLEQLAAQYPNTCPTLYNRSTVKRTSSTVAHKEMLKLVAGKINFAKDYGLSQRDITAHYLVEARHFARIDEPVNGKYKRYGSLKNWTVENLGIDMGADGINNGADQYNGMCEINMDQWYHGFVGRDAKVYRHITLPAGRYAFNAYATSCYGMENGTTYMFVSRSLPTTSTIGSLEQCWYHNMAISAHTGWWGIEFTLDEASDIWLGWCADFDTGNYELRISDIQLVRCIDTANGWLPHDDEALHTDDTDLYIPVNLWADKGTYQGYKPSCQADANDQTLCRLADWKNRAAVVGDVDFGEGKYDTAYFMICYDGASLYGNSGASSLTADNTIDLWIDNTNFLDNENVVLNGTHIASLPGTEVGGVMTTYEVFEVPIPDDLTGVHTVFYKQNGYGPLMRGVGFRTKKIIIDENIDYVPVSNASIDVLLRRTIKEGVNTVVLPFALAEAEVQECFGDGSKVYVPQSFDGECIHLTVQDGIEANCPVLLVATLAGNEYSLSDRTIETDAPISTTADGRLSMVGSYNATTQVLADGRSYVVSDAKLYLVDSDDVVMKGTRAYFQTISGEVKPVLTLGFEGATGIEAIDHYPLTIENEHEGVYDLTGRRVNTQRSTLNTQLNKGLYIVNGKKCLIK